MIIQKCREYNEEAKYSPTCPYCYSPAYVGLNVVECTHPGCVVSNVPKLPEPPVPIQTYETVSDKFSVTPEFVKKTYAQWLDTPRKE